MLLRCGSTVWFWFLKSHPYYKYSIEAQLATSVFQPRKLITNLALAIVFKYPLPQPHSLSLPQNLIVYTPQISDVTKSNLFVNHCNDKSKHKRYFGNLHISTSTSISDWNLIFGNWNYDPKSKLGLRIENLDHLINTWYNASLVHTHNICQH